jgi:hypothetical protein
MKNKATHYGTCQLCGSLQKLPDGVLATHGYQIHWNQFHGTCRGTGHLPFEQSKDLAEQQILDSEDYLKSNAKPVDPGWQFKFNSPEKVAYHNLLNIRHGHESWLRFLKPRVSKWSVKPLKEVREEDAKAETIKVASRNVRQLASFRNDAKYDLSNAIDAVDKIVGWSEFGCLNSSNCVNVATRILSSNGTNSYGNAFSLDDAEAAISHLLTAQAVWLAAKAAADEAKAAFEADKAQARREARKAA